MLYYQSQIDHGRVVGAEALVRCAQLATWSFHKKRADFTIAVNVSARQASQPNFVGEVLLSLNKYRVKAANLKLELTENTLVSNFEDVIAKMIDLKSLGVRFALDGFGTGYTSFPISGACCSTG